MMYTRYRKTNYGPCFKLDLYHITWLRMLNVCMFHFSLFVVYRLVIDLISFGILCCSLNPEFYRAICFNEPTIKSNVILHKFHFTNWNIYYSLLNWCAGLLRSHFFHYLSQLYLKCKTTFKGPIHRFSCDTHTPRQPLVSFLFE